MEYAHTQRAPLHFIIDGTAAILFVAAWLSRGDPVIAPILVVSGCVVVVFALSFRYLAVVDEGDTIVLRYGPLPLFRRSIPYAEISSVTAGKSSLIDGWGIHYVPGRGWTYNLWGFDCAVVDQGGKIIRIGSDDVENLVDFLNRRIQATPA